MYNLHPQRTRPALHMKDTQCENGWKPLNSESFHRLLDLVAVMTDLKEEKSLMTSILIFFLGGGGGGGGGSYI